MTGFTIFSSDIAGICIFFAGISGFVIFSSDISGFEIPSVLRYFCLSFPRFRDLSYFAPRFRDFSHFCRNFGIFVFFQILVFFKIVFRDPIFSIFSSKISEFFDFLAGISGFEPPITAPPSKTIHNRINELFCFPHSTSTGPSAMKEVQLWVINTTDHNTLLARSLP